jgi:hypothetical protein
MKNKHIISNNGWKYLADLVAPDADKMSPARAEKRKSSHVNNGVDTGFYTWEDWVSVGGEWIGASLIPIESLPVAS